MFLTRTHVRARVCCSLALTAQLSMFNMEKRFRNKIIIIIIIITARVVEKLSALNCLEKTILLGWMLNTL